MNLNHARYLMTILECGSLSAAARRLYISQSALSQTLKQVERELGGPVFTRSDGKLLLTFAGERYLDTARRMTLLETSFEKELDEIRSESVGRLCFGVSMQQGMTLLPRLLPGFIEKFPRVSLDIRENGSQMLTDMVLRGALDMALARTEIGNPQIEYVPVHDERMVLIAGQGSKLYRRLPAGTPVSLGDALEDPFVFLREGHNARAVQNELTRKLGLTLQKLVELDSYETAKRVTIACGALMLTPYSILAKDPDIARNAGVYPLREAVGAQGTFILYPKKLYLCRYMLDWMERVQGFFNPEQEEQGND